MKRSYLPVVLAIFAVSAASAQDPAHQEPDRSFVKITTGAREDVQYALYKRDGESDAVYLELLNRSANDVKVIASIEPKVSAANEKGVIVTAYIKKYSYWPLSLQSSFKLALSSPDVVLKGVDKGTLTVSEEIEVDQDGYQITREKYRFVDADVKAPR